MRVLHVIDSLQTGGAEISLVSLAPHLLALGCDYEVASLAGGSLTKDLRKQGIVAHEVGGAGRLQQLRRLVALVRRAKPDILYTTLFWASQLGRVAGLVTRTPVVGSFVNDTYSPMRLVDNPRLSRAKMTVVQLVDLATSRLPVHYLAVSETVKEANSRYLRIPQEKISVVRRGRDVALYSPSSSGKAYLESVLGEIPTGPVLLNVGRLVDQKGQRYLVEAMRHVVERHLGAVLLIAGEGLHRAALEGLIAELGLRGSVVLLGNRPDVPNLLHSADVAVFPSLYEGAAGVIVEAMMAGKPIVATDLPTIRECLGGAENGLLVPPGDPEALAAALHRVLADSHLRASMGEAASAEARARYDLGDKAEATLRVFSRVLQDR